MTLGQRIKQLRKQKEISQEKLAEGLNVSRSAVAKWETDGGVPELDNLIQLAKIFDITLDELTGNDIKINELTIKNKYHSIHNFENQLYSIELAGWNDGVYDVSIIDEDENFIFYRNNIKAKYVYGVLGKKYITSFRVTKENVIENIPEIQIDREYFCGKPVKVELAKEKGFIKGFFDFRDDDYRNTVIDYFDDKVICIQFGKKIDINEITKIEELEENP